MPRSRKTILQTLLPAVAVLLLSLPASAGEKEADFFGLSLGLKGSAGGNYLTAPDHVPDSAAMFTIYKSGAGGWGAGGGLYTEFRVLWGYLGLEVDLLYDYSRNWAGVDFSQVVGTDWVYESHALRVPLLLKGSMDLDYLRVSLGLGPEFVIGVDAGTAIELSSGGEYVKDSDLDEARRAFRASKQIDTFLCADLGLAFRVWEMLSLTVDLRYAYNLTQPADYNDRVTYESSADGLAITTIASNTMDGRVLVGAAWEMAFGL